MEIKTTSPLLGRGPPQRDGPTPRTEERFSNLPHRNIQSVVTINDFLQMPNTQQITRFTERIPSNVRGKKASSRLGTNKHLRCSAKHADWRTLTWAAGYYSNILKSVKRVLHRCRYVQIEDRSPHQCPTLKTKSEVIKRPGDKIKMGRCIRKTTTTS